MGPDFFVENTKNMQPGLADCYRQWIPDVQAEIQRLFPREPSTFWLQTLFNTKLAVDADAVVNTIVQPTYLYIDRPGKMLRPLLSAVVLDAFNADVARYRSVLALIELMEITTISLNDVWDDSLFRRGGPCTHIVYDKAVAYVAALGGYAYCQRFLFENQLNLSIPTRLKLYRAFAFEDLQFFLGDLVETLWPLYGKAAVDENHYFQEVVSRCAFLSFRGPARIGAILADANESQINLLERFGMLTGLAYHLRGDNLNFSAQSKTWGKNPYEDITAGRRSLVTSYAYINASPKDQQRILQILDSHTDDEDTIKEFISLMHHYEAPQYCEQRAQTLLETAKNILAQLDISETHRKLLSNFADFMVERDK